MSKIPTLTLAALLFLKGCNFDQEKQPPANKKKQNLPELNEPKYAHYREPPNTAKPLNNSPKFVEDTDNNKNNINQNDTTLLATVQYVKINDKYFCVARDTNGTIFNKKRLNIFDVADINDFLHRYNFTVTSDTIATMRFEKVTNNNTTHYITRTYGPNGEFVAQKRVEDREAKESIEFMRKKLQQPESKRPHRSRGR